LLRLYPVALCGCVQVGPGFVVAQASDHKSETLAKT
jgi:hypothetical protein